MTDPQTFPADAEMMRTLRDAMAASVLAITQSMPRKQRAAVAANLAALARNAETAGNTALETALLDLYRLAHPG